MLKDHKYIDVLTTFGDTTLAQVQDSDSTAQRDIIEKFSNADSIISQLPYRGKSCTSDPLSVFHNVL